MTIAASPDRTELPHSDWTTIPLGSLCRIELGKTPARGTGANWDTEKATNNVWLSIADMPLTTHAEALDSREYVSGLAAQTMKLVPKGTLLVSFKLTLGRLCYAGRELFTNEAIASLLELDESRILKEYLYWYLTYFDWGKAAAGDHKVKGKTLNKAKLKSLPILLPSIDEQKRIVAVLDQAFAALDRARAHAEANLADTRLVFERTAKAIFSSEEAGNTQSVSEVAERRKGSIRTGPFGSQLKHGEFVDLGVRVLGIDNAVHNSFQWGKPRHITEEKYSQLSRYRVFPDDVIITIMGTCGRCAIIPRDIPKAINTKHLCCITLDNKKCLPKYLHRYFLLSQKALEYLAAQTKGTVMDGLNMGIIKNLPVDLPSINKQQAICDAIGEIEERTDALSEYYSSQLSDISELRQSLLNRAFAGELN